MKRRLALSMAVILRILLHGMRFLSAEPMHRYVKNKTYEAVSTGENQNENENLDFSEFLLA